MYLISVRLTHSTDLLEFTSLVLLGLGALLIAEWATERGYLQPRISRRLVHLTIGLFIAMAVVSVETATWLYLVALFAVAFNVVAYNKGWMASIHIPGSKSIGSVTFPLALVVMMPFFWFTPPVERYSLAIAFSVLAVSDPLAAIAGRAAANHRILGFGSAAKTLAGSLAFGFSAWLIAGLWMTLLASTGLLPFDIEWVWHAAALVAIVAAATEAVSHRGWDNFFVVVSIVLVIAGTTSNERVRFLGWCIVAAIVFAFVTYRLRFLNFDGAIVGGLMGGAILFFGGWVWIVPPLAFFATASLLSAWSARKRGLDVSLQVRGGRRDAVQVLANGAVGWVLVILNHFIPAPGAYWLFAAAFAAAAADTFATEIGTAVRGRTWSIVTALRVDPGTSGGVSVAGTLAAVLGGLVVALAAVGAEGEFALRAILVVSVAGFLAAAADSLLGATVQGRYRDHTGRITDAAVSNGVANEHIGGSAHVDNDMVNLLCTAVGAAVAAVVVFG